LPAGLTEMPALFVTAPSGDADGAELVNYLARGRWLVAQRIAPSFVLRLGREQVHVLREAAAAKPSPAEWSGPLVDPEAPR
jgi:hypothetical protein